MEHMDQKFWSRTSPNKTPASMSVMAHGIIKFDLNYDRRFLMLEDCYVSRVCVSQHKLYNIIYELYYNIYYIIYVKSVVDDCPIVKDIYSCLNLKQL